MEKRISLIEVNNSIGIMKIEIIKMFCVVFQIKEIVRVLFIVLYRPLRKESIGLFKQAIAFVRHLIT